MDETILDKDMTEITIPVEIVSQCNGLIKCDKCGKDNEQVNIEYNCSCGNELYFNKRNQFIPDPPSIKLFCDKCSKDNVFNIVEKRCECSICLVCNDLYLIDMVNNDIIICDSCTKGSVITEESMKMKNEMIKRYESCNMFQHMFAISQSGF